MNRVFRGSKAVCVHRRRATSFFEVLLVLSILSMLFSLVLPALSSSRHGARTTQCLSNLREIAATAIMYSDDNGGGLDRGNGPAMPWHLGWQYGGLSCSIVSEFIYGGFQPTVQHPEWPNGDWYVYPTEIRPFNKYVAPGMTGRTLLEIYVCPSDDRNVTLMVGSETEPYVEERWGSWEVNGNSYAINWYWNEMYGGSGYDLETLSRRGSELLRKKVGGSASKFVLFMESCMNSYMMDARPPDGSYGESQLQMLGAGWHRKRSRYSMAMWDGHAEFRFIDTRFTSDSGYSTWPDPY